MNIHRTRRALPWGVLGAMVLGTALAGCGQDLPTNNPLDVGSVAVFVEDQNGNGVPAAEVTITVPGVGGTFDDASPTLATGSEVGNVVFSNIAAGSSQIWATPPTGYSGGGQANAQTITIVTNQTTEVTIRLVNSAG